MTIYGGKKIFSTFSEIVVDGFFVSCTKCGWHSKVRVWAGHFFVHMKCDQCGNEYKSE